MTKLSEKYQGLFLDQNQSPSQFLERRLATIYGINSMAIRALDLIREEMCAAKGFKRDNGTDYYNHCVDVANTLISFGITDEDVICAALLHDIIEDVEGYRRITIERMFNENIARLVMLVTKEHGVDYKQPEAINRYIEGILSDMNAAAIKTADRMHNMMTLEEKSFEARYRKAMETKTYYLPFFKQSRYMYPRYENLFYAARAEIEPLIFHIESFYEEILRLNSEIETLRSGKSSEESGES
ncbi:MAG: HD domain-containing protein [Clostridia bacterium]|nr:HD domain-containing protein [Clostridia bacterium]